MLMPKILEWAHVAVMVKGPNTFGHIVYFVTTTLRNQKSIYQNDMEMILFTL